MMVTSKTILVLLVLVVQLPFAQSEGVYPDIKVIESDATGITFEFRPKYSSDQIIEFDGTAYARPTFDFGFSPYTSESGKQDIRVRTIQIALPGSSGNNVSVVSSDYETVTNFSLVPVPTIKPIDNLGAMRKEYKINFTAPADYFPSSIVSLKNIGSVKGWITGSIQIAPYQYQTASKTLRRYSKIVVRVNYGLKGIDRGGSGNDDWAKVSLLNYPAGKMWTSTVRQFKKMSAVSSVLSTGKWFKLEVVQDGIYKIDATYLRSLGVDPVSLNSLYDVKIFGASGKVLPAYLNAQHSTDLPQVAVEYVDKNHNAKFDNDDYVLFFGQGITGWNYNSITKEYSHYTNPYTNSNYYFLGINAAAAVKQIPSIAANVVLGGKVSTAIGKTFFDDDKINFNQSGLNWVGAPLSANGTQVIRNKLNGWISGTPIQYKYLLYSRSNVGSTFKVEESGIPIANSAISYMSDYDLNDPTTDYANVNNYYGEQVTTYPSLSDQQSILKFTYQLDVSTNIATGYIDWVEIFYKRDLSAVNGQLLFDSPDTNGIVGFQLSSFFADSISVFDVTDVNNLRKVENQMGQIAGDFSFKDTVHTGNPKRYWAGSSSQYLSPKSFNKIVNSDLHGFNGAEFIIITPNEFKSEATRLKNHKESLPQSVSTVVVDVDTIYNEFGIGISDPVALRDFLRFAYNNWNIKPRYVLLFGDASYDYKSILNTDRSWVPTVETDESNSKISSYNYDDFYTYLDPLAPLKVSLALGRLCPRSESDAKFIVDRIIQYENKQVFTPWKNQITIVGDDLWTPERAETEHTLQAETLSNPPYTPKSFEVNKIFEGEYPTVFTSSGRRKPEARQAILDHVNNGTLLLNYTGHGNPKVWAHESILTLDDVKNQFHNSDKLTFIVAATCDWGRYDEAGEQSSAEEVVMNRKGGAIGVFSASRAVFSDQNSETNKRFYLNLFGNNPALPLGDVTMLTKNDINDNTAFNSNTINEQKYFLLGDPTLRLAIPTGTLTIDSINGKSVVSIDTIRSLEKITIKASVRSSNNTVNTSYNGNALVTIFDSEKLSTFKEIPGNTFSQDGAVLFKGENSVTNGLLEATFIVPKDISYESRNGRVSVYFSNGTSDGRGFTRNIIVGGSIAQSRADSVGPVIAVYFDNTSFRSGDLVTDHPTLIVTLKDSSGINSSSSGIGHRIEAWIDGSSKSIDLTDYYKSKINTYQEGSAEYSLSDLSVGSHHIKVRGWDVYNNSATAEAYFSVASSEGLSLQQVYNFPNPVSTSTAFTFQVNQIATLDAEIKIYTVTGRLIHTIKRYGITDRFVKIDWDRRDSDGDEVGNGVYFYRVIAHTIDGKFTSEATGKLAIVR